MADTLAQLVELGQFLTVDTRTDVKLKALEYIQGITSHGEFAIQLLQEGDVVKSLVALALDDPVQGVREFCIRILVNFTINDVVSSSPILLEEKFLSTLLKDTVDRSSKTADYSAMLLTNITRIDSNCTVFEQLLDKLNGNGVLFRDLFCAFIDNKYNSHCQLNYLGSFISNLLTLRKYRIFLLCELKDLLVSIPPYTRFQSSSVRRAAAARILKNCSFESDYHEMLLGEELELLPHLLLPLAGPEELPEDEMEQLPIDLQYLPQDKTREPEPEIRILLINTLHQLCTTKNGRDTLKKNGVYYILRELHNAETDEMVSETLMPVIQVLIMDEPEPGMENMKGYEIPSDIVKKFEDEMEKQTSDTKTVNDR